MLIGQQQQLQKSFNAPVSDYYDGLNNEQRTEFRDHVMAAMDISWPLFIIGSGTAVSRVLSANTLLTS